MLKLNRSLALIGLKSSGKSTIGKALAKTLGVDFFDTDAVIESSYFSQTGTRLNFRDIYQEQGERRFRALETQALKDILAHPEVSVIATGGSCVLNQDNALLLQQQAKVIYLEAGAELLKQRWRQNPPSFIDPQNFDQAFNDYYQQRASLYQQLSEYQLSVDQFSCNEAVDQLILKLSY